MWPKPPGLPRTDSSVLRSAVLSLEESRLGKAGALRYSRSDTPSKLGTVVQMTFGSAGHDRLTDFFEDPDLFTDAPNLIALLCRTVEQRGTHRPAR